MGDPLSPAAAAAARAQLLNMLQARLSLGGSPSSANLGSPRATLSQRRRLPGRPVHCASPPLRGVEWQFSVRRRSIWHRGCGTLRWMPSGSPKRKAHSRPLSCWECFKCTPSFATSKAPCSFEWCPPSEASWWRAAMWSFVRATWATPSTWWRRGPQRQGAHVCRRLVGPGGPRIRDAARPPALCGG